MAATEQQVDTLPIINDAGQLASFYLQINPRTGKYRYQHMAPARMKQLFEKWHPKMRPGAAKTAVEQVMANLN